MGSARVPLSQQPREGPGNSGAGDVCISAVQQGLLSVHLLRLKKKLMFRRNEVLASQPSSQREREDSEGVCGVVLIQK